MSESEPQSQIGETESKVKTEAMPVEGVDFKSGAALILLALLWGGHPVAMKFGLKGALPIGMGAIRFAIGAISIALWCAFTGVPLRMKRDEVKPILWITLLFTAQIVALNWGTHLTTAAHSTVLINTHVFFVSILAHFLIPGDRLNVKKLIGIVLSFCGVASIFRGSLELGESSNLLGDSIVLVSGFLLAFRAVFGKRIMQYVHVYRFLAWQMIFGLIPFTFLSLYTEGVEGYNFTPTVVFSHLYQGVIVAGFCFVLWHILLKRKSPSKIVVFFCLTPIFGVILSALFLSEKITWDLAAGALLVAAGMYVVNKS